MRGIDAAGVYVPTFRLESDEIADTWGSSAAPGISQRAVPAADEDAVTMAIAAAETLFSGSGDIGVAAEREPVDRTSIGRVLLATTTPPLAEEELTSRLVRALGLDGTVSTRTYTASAVAGGAALADAVAGDGPTLVVAADCPRGDLAGADHAFGAGAAAFLVTDDATVACTGTAEAVDEYPGVRYRDDSAGAVDSLGVTGYERDAVATLLSDAAAGLDVDLASVTGAAVHQPDGKTPYRATGGLALDADAVTAGTVVDQLGDAGAATVTIGLLNALNAASADDETVALAFGGGAAAVALGFEGGLSIDVPGALDGGEAIAYARSLRQRGDLGATEVAGGGVNVSWPTWTRSLDQRYRLVAGRCPDCAGITFPPEGACTACHERVEFERVELPRVGTVDSLTSVSAGEPPEFATHQRENGPYGVLLVRFDVGESSVRIPGMLTDADTSDLAIGDSVVATVRRIYEQEGLPRYGVKFTPSAGGSR